MEVVKFRAWDAKGRKMRYSRIGDYSNIFSPVTFTFDTLGEMVDNNGEMDQSMPLMLFSGLGDTKGREVYEGDILRVGEHYDGDNTHRQYLGVVTLVIGDCWWVKQIGRKDDGDSLFDAVFNHQAEVVGDIYENPSLLED